MKKHLILLLIPLCLLLHPTGMAQNIPSFVKDSLVTYVERAMKDFVEFTPYEFYKK